MHIEATTLLSLMTGAALVALETIRRALKRHKVSLVLKPGKFQITWLP